MIGLWSRLKRWFAYLTARRAQPEAVAEWEVEQQKNCRVYRGSFVVYDHRGRAVKHVAGWIVEWPGLATDVYLRDPPTELRQHAKGPCLQLLSPNSAWFKLHWEKPARDFNDSRAYVEKILDEAVRQKRSKRT